MKQNHKFPYMLVFLTSLIIGFLGGNFLLQSGKAADTTPVISDRPVVELAKSLEVATETIELIKPVSTPSATQQVGPDASKSISNGQRSILMVAVDNLRSEHPRLEGIWLLVYRPTSPGPYLMPLYPASLAGASPDRFLENNYSLTSEGAFAQPFTAFLHGREIWWTNYMVIDETGISSVVDLLGGIPEEGGSKTGHQVISEFTRPWDNPGQALQNQTSVLKDLCEVAQADTGMSLAEGLHKLVGHIRTDMGVNQLSADLQSLRDSDGLTCKFPTQNQAQNVAGN